MNRAIVFCALVLPAITVFAQTQVPHNFQSGTQARAAEVNANFDAVEAAIDSNLAVIEQLNVTVAGLDAMTVDLQGEQAIQAARLSSLESRRVPQWKITSRDKATGNDLPPPNLFVLQYPAYGNGNVASVIMDVTLVAGGTAWIPGVYAETNHRITPTWQGLEIDVIGVLGFAPGSGCSGEPLAIVFRQPRSDVDANGLEWLNKPKYFNYAYDPRNGRIYRAFGGGSDPNFIYDLYEYGYDLGWLPNGAFGCTQNVDLSADPAFELSGFPGQYTTLRQIEYWADNPYFDPNYEETGSIDFEVPQ